MIELTVTKPIPAGHNGLPRDLQPGDVVFKFTHATYGAIDSSREVAISLTGSHVYPFHGVPLDSVVR